MTKQLSVRTAGLVASAAFILAAVVAPSATMASKPIDGEHKVTICHRTNSDTNPYVVITVDVASAGENVDGHASEHLGPVWDATLKDQHIEWGDIIPPYTYGDFSFAGYNWSDAGQALWNNGCVVPTPTPTATVPVEPTPTPTTPVEPTPTATVPVEPTPTATVPVEPTPTATVPVEPTPTATPSGQVQGETGKPQFTPPSTDTTVGAGTTNTVGGGMGLALLALGGLVALALLVTPARRRAK